MIVLKTNVKNLLSKDISVEQRGLIITAMLCKDTIPAMTLAKFKYYVDVKKFRSDLVFLHEQKYIKWSGYKAARRTLDKLKDNPTIHKVIEFMNNLYGRNFDSKTESTISELRNRLKEYSLDDIKLVVSNRYEEWKDDDIMCKHLNPTTIFRKSKFIKYYEEASRTQVGSGIVKAVSINLRDGDELTYSNTKDFSDNDLYSLKTYQTSLSGNKIGNGKLEQHYGKNVKKMLNIQNNLQKRGGKPNLIYIFVKR